MPFFSAKSPSLQLGLLSAIGESHGFPTSTFHLNLELAQRIDFAIYEELCQMRGRMTGDWLFSVAAFREDAPDRAGRFVADFPDEVAAQLGDASGRARSPVVDTRHRRMLLRIRNEIIPAYLDAMMREIDWSSFRVVGFSSVFQQTVASIALARRIKEAFPHVVTVFGGSNFEGEMGAELVRKVPWIDHAVLGEGDVALPELLVALAEGKSTTEVPGVASRVDGDIVFGGKPRLLEDLDRLPTPRYGEYFTRAEAVGLIPRTRRRSTRLPFESARGCWWGEKHHCTFCGLNGESMRFRAKSPARVARDLADMAKAYGSFSFYAVDNIVDRRYSEAFFPEIESKGLDYKFFYEVKSNLTREQVRRLAAAGVVEIQPGIESLSSHVLQLMRKGVTAAQNVNLLRWATYYGIWVGWNVLWGFPGEREEDYVEQAALVTHLTHLTPPSMPGVRIVMERFSPLFTDRTSFPAEHVRAEASYRYVYPSTVDVEKVAYIFDYSLHDTLPDRAYEELGARLRAWVDAWAGAPSARASEGAELGRTRPTLTFAYSDDFLQIADGRRQELRSLAYEGAAARLYKAAVDRPVRAATAAERAGLAPDDPSARELLERFCEEGLMMRDGAKFLALALPATPGR